MTATLPGMESYVPSTQLALPFLTLVPTKAESKDSDEWYTPIRYIEAARQVMGGIDLDPATCLYAQQTVGATCHYTVADDGLSMPWAGRVWLNPPYSDVTPWTDKLLASYRSGDVTSAMLLIPPHTERAWFQELFSWPMCFTSSRIRFGNPGKNGNSPRFGNVFVHLPGPDTQDRFYEVFGQFGRVGKLSVF